MVDSIARTTSAAGAGLPCKNQKPLEDADNADHKGKGAQSQAAIVTVQAKGAGERSDAIRSFVAAEAETQRVAVEIIANPLKSLEVHNLNSERVERLTNDES